MISKRVISYLISATIFTSSASVLAQAPVANFEDAKSVLIQLAVEYGSGNDENAVFVTAEPPSKALLLEILKVYGDKKDMVLVQKADFVGVIVENNDEEDISYYVINKGQTQSVQVGGKIHYADLYYDVCDMGRTPKDLHPKFTQIKNLLLGLDPKQSVAGTVWLGDLECDKD